MKIAKRILLSSIALMVAAAFVVTMISVITGETAALSNVRPGANSGEPFKQPNSVTSDGKVYPFKQIDAVTLEETIPKESLPAVGDMQTLLKLLKERGAFYDGSAYGSGGARNWFSDAPVPSEMVQEEMDAGAGMASDAESEAGKNASHSETNEQVAGVNEGDVVKTDGKYIYALSGNELRITEANGAEMRAVSRIEFQDIWGAEFYLIGDKLAVIGQEHIPMDIMPVTSKVDGEAPDIAWWYPSRSATVLLVYDIADRANPYETRRVSMEGWNVSTRVIGDTVYLVTNKHVWVPYDNADSEIILPCARDTAEGEAFEPLGLDRIFYVPGTDDSSYLLVGAVNINSDELFQPTAYLGAGSMVYMSRGALYVTKMRWVEASDDTGRLVWGGRQMTDILRFAIDGTDVYYAGMGTVDGTPINQYSMDEYNGFFRIATTDWQKGTLVVVLDGNMNIAGRTEYLAPGEWMQSMRFMGDMGYVVTFENVDPLFTIDLKDPYNPKVLGELKIPGFSQYLHPVGGGLLMGIGRDTQELFTRDANGNETVVGFRDVGMKVSLFDVSNPYDPKEVDVLHLGEGWAEVSHNPRALMVDASRNLYGFTIDRWTQNRQGPSALILRVEGNRLSIAADLSMGEKFYTWNSRLLFIGDTLYLSHEQGIRAYDYYTFAESGMLAY
ncbi:MAG: beta-propeller domain-containing protein [Oscillospiraceae bacterium]|jgi:uncharacterized secreted protein with C-terminal beta-propeller domain|nr:beta-propeller domain-containing protein [Oscillospiraceae bacterium]